MVTVRNFQIGLNVTNITDGICIRENYAQNVSLNCSLHLAIRRTVPASIVKNTKAEWLKATSSHTAHVELHVLLIPRFSKLVNDKVIKTPRNNRT